MLFTFVLCWNPLHIVHLQGFFFQFWSPETVYCGRQLLVVLLYWHWNRFPKFFQDFLVLAFILFSWCIPKTMSIHSESLARFNIMSCTFDKNLQNLLRCPFLFSLFFAQTIKSITIIDFLSFEGVIQVRGCSSFLSFEGIIQVRGCSKV